MLVTLAYRLHRKSSVSKIVDDFIHLYVECNVPIGVGSQTLRGGRPEYNTVVGLPQFSPLVDSLIIVTCGARVTWVKRALASGTCTIRYRLVMRVHCTRMTRRYRIVHVPYAVHLAPVSRKCWPVQCINTVLTVLATIKLVYIYIYIIIII